MTGLLLACPFSILLFLCYIFACNNQNGMREDCSETMISKLANCQVYGQINVSVCVFIQKLLLWIELFPLKM